ncbi:MAG: superoxide dismutase family protein [Desulfobacterales bacterium]
MRVHRTLLLLIFILAVSTATTLCPALAGESYGAQINKAVAVLHPTRGSNVTGTVYFSRTPNGVQVTADVMGLGPGKHGFHIHEFGDCTAPDGTSAGGHFNPENRPHAGPEQANRHVGDLGNIEADAGGNAHYVRTDSQLKFDGPDSIIGRGVIVHAGADDLVSQPSGNAGPRIACGVIGIAKD